MNEFTPEVLSAIAGAILSLLFSYIPKLNTWFAKQLEETKKLLMLALLAVVAGGIFGLSCTPYGEMLKIPLTCDKAGAFEMIKILVFAIMGNQGVYSLTVQTGAVKAAKAQAKAAAWAASIKSPAD